MKVETENPSPEFEKATYSKITWRLMPFLFICYMLAYMDRVNVGFAKLQMQQDLRMSDSVYGLGAGIFFVSYFFFEVPANMILQKVGARLWLGPIMILWGLISSATLFVHSAASYYALRFALGIAESGFFPGVILYLTFWYTRTHRARMVATFMSAIPLSGVFAGPLSGWILGRMSGVGQLRGWQWLFLIEGIPSAVAGIMAIFLLVDSPSKAKWLAPEERDLLLWRLHEEEEVKRREGEVRYRLMDAFRSGKVWLLCVVYFGMVMGNYGLQFWLPQTISDSLTKDPWHIGLISAIPWGLGAIAMILYGHHSDATGERRWHVGLAGIVGALAFAASSLPGMSGTAAFVALTVAAITVLCAHATFWALPTALLSGTAAATGIAWVNSVGNLAGYVSSYVIGTIRDATGSMTLALMALSSLCLISGVIALRVARQKQS